MGTPLRVIIVEDSRDDTDLLLRQLRQGGFDPAWERVDTPAALRAALERQTWDLVLSDHAMPHFSATAALALLKECAVDLPFIIISGQMGEAAAVAAMKAGAHDYILKDNLTRLIPAIERELREAALRREQRQAEAALRESEARFRAIVEDQTDLIYRARADGALTFVNDAYCRYLGQTAETLIGRNVTPTIHPEDVGFVKRKRAALSAGNPMTTYWHRVVAPSGEIRWQQWTDRALYTRAGQLVEIQSVGQDITGRKRAELALKQRNEELLALNAIAAIIGQPFDLERLAHAILDKLIEVLDLDGGWVHLVEGAGDERSLQLAAQRGFPPAVLAAIQRIELDHDQPDLAAHGLDVVQFNLKIDQPEARPALTGALIASKDQALGMLGVFRRNERAFSGLQQQLLATIGHQFGVAADNARLAQQAAEIELLRELDRLRAELIANVSHELRTPLGLITISASTLLRDDVDFDRETQRGFLRDIEEEAGKLEKIVSNLLDLSRLQSGQMRLDRQPTDLGRLAAETLDTMRHQLARYRLECDFPPQPLMALTDPKRIEQVLRNLISNAIKYSPEAGKITLRGRASEIELVVQVSDQGLGIPAEDLERVFERFYRVEDERTHSIPGVGLGLAVCRGIIEAHGGRIWAESTLGAGSTFSFTLPVARRLDYTHSA